MIKGDGRRWRGRHPPPPSPAATATAAAAALCFVCLLSLVQGLAAVDEAAILRRLRQAVHDTDPAWVAGLAGWQRDDTSDPCSWAYIRCLDQRVTHVRLSDYITLRDTYEKDHAAARWQGAVRPGPLLPELAQLECLEDLQLQRGWGPWWAGGVPAEWVQPGAFPRLKKLYIKAPGIHGTLPDMYPGALTHLIMLSFRSGIAATLPDTWGHEGVLPMLQTLDLGIPVLGPLPTAWSAGFQQLKHLALRSYSGFQGDADVVLTQGPRRLPESWASGFPALLSLDLQNLGFSGPYPTTWSTGFPSLVSIYLHQNHITGHLPQQFTLNQSQLSLIAMSDNAFSGSLPNAWASNSITMLLLANNKLSGPAFPKAWQPSGSMPLLERLDLSGNRELTGTLPPDLLHSWPMMSRLFLSGTSLQGTVPASWCSRDYAFWRHINLRDTGIDRTVTPAQLLCLQGKLESIQGLLLLHGAHGGGTALQLTNAVLLLLCALAVLFVAGWRMLQERSCRWLGRLQFTAARGEGRLAQNDGFVGREQRGAGCAVGAAPIQQRHARLKTLVQAQLSRHGRTVELVALENALPAAVTHRLVSTKGTHSDSTALGAEVEGSSPWSSGALNGIESVGSAGAGRGRQQTLALQSLLLQAGELEAIHDASGHLVELGYGASAYVFLGRLSGVVVAVKALEVQSGLHLDGLLREAQLLRQCAHARIVPLFGVATEGGLLMLATEYMSGGTLKTALSDPETRPQLQWHARGRRVALDVTEGVAHLHRHHVLHSDLKSSNVMLSEEMRASVGDLGTALLLGSAAAAASAQGFSHTHAAPEVLLGERSGLAADVYSLGIVLIELSTLEPLLQRGSWRMPSSPHDCPQDVLTLIQECVATDPALRPSAAQVLQRLADHPAVH